jgi:hypothetical protein
MMAGDPKYNITQQQYERVVKEEFVSMLQEEYGDGVLEEGFWDKLKGGGKKIVKSYVNVFKAYAEVVEDLLGLTPDDPKMDAVGEEVPDPEELAQDVASGEGDAAGEAMDDIEANLDALKNKAADDPEAAKKVDALIAQVRQQGDAMDQAADGDAGAGGEPTEDTPALLDLLDAVADEWDQVQNKTKDGSLKKAMGYIEKIALAEIRKQRGLKKLKQIREKRKNG